VAKTPAPTPGTPGARRAAAPRAVRRRFVTTVHARRPGSLEGMLTLQACASGEGTLEEILAGVADQIAELLGVEVCSIYLRDQDDDLVLAATHGYSREAVGEVRMRVGEGLTGFAVECLRPVSVAMATVDARNKSFSALPEERYPALCALPLIDGGRAVGAVVIQRRQPRAFGERELVLIAAMAPVVLFAVERDRRRKSELRTAADSPRSNRVASLAVRGVPAAPGRAVGVVSVHRAPLSHPESRAADADHERAVLLAAFAADAAEVAELDEWARRRLAEVAAGSPADDSDPEATAQALRAARGSLLAVRSIVDDARLKQRALRHVASGFRAMAAVERVAREYARVLGASPDETLQERAIEVEALCGRVLARLAGPPQAAVPARVLVAARLTVYEALALCKDHGAAAVLAMPAAGSTGIAVAHAIGLPVVADVRALFRWAHDGDRVLVDGSVGTLLINPPRSEIAAFRRDRR